MKALNKKARLVSSTRISEIANGANLIMGEKEWLANTAIYLANELKTATKAFQSTGFSLLEAEEKLEAAEKRIAELESRTVTVKLPNGDRDIAAFRIDPTEGPSWLTFRCEEDLRENGVIGEFDSVVPLSVITSDAPKRGEVVVTVSGLTGSGKSAIAGEIEIAMRAIGVPVHWMNGGAEKRMTGADWLTAIEMYKPTVRIVEVNVPRAAGIGVKGD
ncbi:hypothetical protein [Citrobacter portucalensis]|uniref:hypothetical protein n=1 Tax=Citrobacter portucalensis TaxID=1639133 RepID=UPI00397B6370